MKDNKIDIMCSKLGNMVSVLNLIKDGTLKNPNRIDDLIEGLRQLQYDLELLRKCTLDNPDFKLSDEISRGYTRAKSEAFRNE